MSSESKERAEALAAARPGTADEAMTWLAEIWQYFLETGLFFAGGPADETTVARIELIGRARHLAQGFNEPEVLTEALRISAHVLNAAERYREAMELYARAIEGLEAAGNLEEASSTRLGWAAAQLMSGEYESALATCKAADAYFVAHGDEASHGKALVNIGNIYHRLDQHGQALECQLEAAEIFKRHDSRQQWAVTCSNIANSFSFLDRFDESDAMYAQTIEAASACGMTALADQARYNRAYLEFLRGRYSDAIEAFNALRKRFIESRSERHAALCDLDEAEIYLQLNLPEDAATLSANAWQAFSRLEMQYESAKAMAYAGVAKTQQGHYQEALECFERAEPMFAAESNEFWSGMIELYRGEVLLALGRHWESRFLAESALARFDVLGISYQLGMSLILLGRTLLASQQSADVGEVASRLNKLVETTNVPLLEFPAHLLCAEVAERDGDAPGALRLYEQAAASIEAHRSYLHHDELRVRFLEGKQKVYESLVRLVLARGDDRSEEEAYAWCERAKGRALAELLGRHILNAHSEANPELLDHITRLREELSSQSVRSRPEARELHAPVEASQLASTEEELERQLKQLAELDDNFASLLGSNIGSLEEIRRALPIDTTLVEFFVARGEVMAFVVDSQRLTIFRRLTSIEKVQQMRAGLEFQMHKFALGPAYIERHGKQMLATTQSYLQQLYQDLVSPWVDSVSSRNLLVVPHGDIHALPVHSFFDGERYLMDRFGVSFAPSADVFRHVASMPGSSNESGLIVGLADELAPAIAEEIQRLGDVMPGAVLLAGEAATREDFFRQAPAARFVHISTHSFFQRDNPMFSGFKLADGAVTALDLYSRNWRCDLVVLSGCSSARSGVSGGDDLMGLIRGFMHAGTRSLLVSQWNVSDEATVLLAEAFYREWNAGTSKRDALQQAMLAVRTAYPHPFYWAPFILIGSPE